MRRRIIFVVILLNLLPATTLAVSQSDLDAANENTPFYDPGYVCNDDTGTSTTSTGITGATGSDNEEKAFNFYVSNFGLSGFQAAAIVGNYMQESGLDPTIVNSSSGAYGIAQWLGGRYTHLQAYAGGLSGGIGSFDNQLAFSKAELTESPQYASTITALKATKDLTDAVESYEYYYEGAGATPTSPGVDIQNRINNAQEVLSKYGKDAPGGTSSGTPTTASSSCSNGATTTSAYGSQIVATALGLVWPNPNYTDPDHSPFTSTPAYQKAYDGAGGGQTDCGAFVGSVMHTSKADPNYPAADTVADFDYVTSHKSEFDIINHPTSTSQLQPGDILIYGGNPPDGHTEIYVGRQTGGYVTADASLGGHTPELNTTGDAIWIMQQPGTVAARLITGGKVTVD
jgi:hypothetical protein